MDVGELWDATRAALTDAYQDLIGFAIGAAEAMLVVLVVVLIGRAVRHRVERGLARTGIDPNVAMLATNGVKIGTYALAVGLVLAILGANWTALGALLGAGTVAISFALQDVLRSFVAGLYLLVERPFAIEDRIRVRDVEGRVERIDIRTTMIRSDAGERVLVPNATVFGEIVTNRSSPGEQRLSISVSKLQIEPARLPEKIAEALVGIEGLADRPPVVEVNGAGDEGIEVTFDLWHQAGATVAPAVIGRLRERFPEATVTVGRG